MNDQNTQAKVVVIGGGYAGTVAANRLRMDTDVDVTLVNPRREFVERIRLHQYVARTGDATADFGALLGAGVRLIVDTVTSIDAAARAVQLASGRTVEYDYLIYAVGSTGTKPESVPGVTEFAYPIGELELAQRLRAKLDSLHSDAWITVVGAGPTGIETAAELAEQGRKVTLVCGGRLGPALSERARRSTAKWFATHRVAVLESDTVVEVRPNAVVFADGAVRPSALTIWTAGFGVPDLATRSGLRTDALGRLLTDETLTSINDDRIVAAGDAAAPSGRPLRMSCYAAEPLGAQAADTVRSRIAGTMPAALDLAFVAYSVSLGRRAAIGQFTRKDDTTVNFSVGGRIGAVFKTVGMKATLWAIRLEAGNPGLLFWPKSGKRSSLPEMILAHQN